MLRHVRTWKGFDLHPSHTSIKVWDRNGIKCRSASIASALRNEIVNLWMSYMICSCEKPLASFIRDAIRDYMNLQWCSSMIWNCVCNKFKQAYVISLDITKVKEVLTLCVIICINVVVSRMFRRLLWIVGWYGWWSTTVPLLESRTLHVTSCHWLQQST